MKMLPAYLLVASLFTAVQASDLAREKRLADEIIDSIMDGEPLYLAADDHEFLSIYTQSDADQVKGAALILHGRGFHPNWKDVTYPLRTGLPETGWHTLAIQMPVLDKTAKYYDYLPTFTEAFHRIDASIRYLKQQGIDNIILIAHSCSVHMSMAWLEYTQKPQINGYVGIGMGATDFKQYMEKPFPLEQLSVPVLDVYGAEDFPAVKTMAPQRLALVKKAGHPKSHQCVVNNANHYFTDQDEALLNEVNNWLERL